MPSVVQTLVKKGFTVNIEEQAGHEAKFTNQNYEEAGANLVNKENAFQSGMIAMLKGSWDTYIFFDNCRYYIKSPATASKWGWLF